MKRVIMAVLTMLVAATLLAAQTQTPPAKPGQQMPAQQQGAKQQPSTPAPTAPAGQAPQPQQPAGPRPPQAKSQEEYAAYQTAAALNDPAQLEAAATEFAAKYPESELRELLFEKDLSLYQNANNPDKTVEVGRKILSMSPESVATLVTVASALASSTRKTDLDAAEKWTEATKDVSQALQLIENGKGIPAMIPAANVEPYKHLVTSMGYGALGTIEFNKENYPAAEQHLRKSVEFNDIAQDPVSWVQLAVALDKQNKYADALTVAEKCVTLPVQGTAVDLCKQEAARLRKLTGAPSAAAPSQQPPAAQQPPATKPQVPPPPK